MRLHPPQPNRFDPTPEFRPWPLFVLNEDYDDETGLNRLLDGLEDLKRAGFGGVFLHPRPGLITEYLSPRWFEVIEACVRKCLEIGLVPGLYDENSYPSGGGGGHTCSIRPETRARYIAPLLGKGPSLPPGAIATYQIENSQPTQRIQNPDTETEWIAFCPQEAKIMSWHGEVPAPNLLDPLTTETFLQVTHEAYKRELPDEVFRAIPAMFTDEPHLIADRHGPTGMGLPITPDFRVRFQGALGYDILDHLPELYYDFGDFEAVRFDFYDFSHRLWVEAWAEPLHKWHLSNGWKLTGHYLEHNWPVPYATPGQMEMLAHMDWPGTDLLTASPLSGHSFTDLQNFGPCEAGTEPHLLFILRQTQSVANQFGKERVMNECWGAGGHESTPADWLRMGRFLVVNGVNLLVPHHSMSSIRGTRKHDHPQFFSPQSPWFDYLPQLNDELGRLCQATAVGRMHNRTLVLDAQSTGYCLARKSDCEKSTSPNPFDTRNVVASEGALAGLRQHTLNTVQALAEAQCDFDIGDEYLIAKHARSEAAIMTLGEQSYQCLVWPQGLIHLRKETAEQIEAYLKSGGRIVGTRPPRYLESGRPTDRLERWEQAYRSQLNWVAPEAIATEVCQLLPPRITVEGAATGLYHQCRKTKDGLLWLVINLSDKSREIQFECKPPEGEIDLLSGEQIQFNAGIIEAHSARLLTENVPKNAKPAAKSIELPESPPSRLVLEKIEAKESNVLVLDRCSLELNGTHFPPEETRKANSRVWVAYGLSAAGWSGTVQYRRQILGRAASYPSKTGYQVEYNFELGDDVDTKDLQLAVETPECWDILINGRSLDYSSANSWIDPNIRRLFVGDKLNEGNNCITIRQAPFDPRAEISPVYLTGDFSLASAETGFRIETPRPLNLGAWSAQGRPFFDREVSYQFTTPAKGGILSVKRSDWCGSWLIAKSGEQRIQLSPDEDLILPLEAGSTILLTVVGLPKNLLGPWHAAGLAEKSGKFGCPLHWEAPFAQITPRPGSDYDLLKLGLLESPLFYTK